MVLCTDYLPVKTSYQVFIILLQPVPAFKACAWLVHIEAIRIFTEENNAAFAIMLFIYSFKNFFVIHV